jgi:hypothetical protein
MAHGRHTASHARAHHVTTRPPGSSRPPRPPGPGGKRRYGWFALLTVSAILIASVVARNVADHATTAAFTTGTACSAVSTLDADSSTTTLLGVDATNTGQLATDTAEFGHLPILRVYYMGLPDPNAWTTGVQAVNHSAIVLSFKEPPAEIMSGKDDAALAHFFDTAPTGHPIYYSYYDEPEPYILNGTFTYAQYRAAWAHIVAIADAAHNPYLKSILILMAYDLNPASGINFKEFMPSGGVTSTLGWDAYPAGTVKDDNPQPTAPADFMGPAEAASRAVGLPFGFAEFALGTETDRPAWLTEVAKYLQDTGALFGTLFDSTGFPWMYLKDTPSIQAWRNDAECEAEPDAVTGRRAAADDHSAAGRPGRVRLHRCEPRQDPVQGQPAGRRRHLRLQQPGLADGPAEPARPVSRMGVELVLGPRSEREPAGRG